MSKPKTWKATPSKTRPGWLTVIGPYDEDFIHDLKCSIDPWDREWVPAPLKVWRVKESSAGVLIDVIGRHTDQVPGGILRATPTHVAVIHPPADAPIPTGLDGARALLGRAQDLGEVVTAMVSEELAEALSLGLEVLGEATPAGTGDLVAVAFESGGQRLVFVGAVMVVGG